MADFDYTSFPLADTDSNAPASASATPAPAPSTSASSPETDAGTSFDWKSLPLASSLQPVSAAPAPVPTQAASTPAPVPAPTSGSSSAGGFNWKDLPIESAPTATTAAPVPLAPPATTVAASSEPTPANKPEDSTWQKIKSFATHPLVSAETMFPEMVLPVLADQALNAGGHPALGKVADAYTGVEKAEADMAAGMTSPLNLGIMAVTGGLGTVEGAAASVASKIGLSPEAIAIAAKYGPQVSRLVNAGFSIAGLKQAYDNLPEIRKAFDAGDTQKTAQLLTSTAGTVAMSGYAGLHALGSVNPGAVESKAANTEPLSNAKVYDLVDSDAAKTHAENAATIQKPEVTPKTEAEAETEMLPAARVVKEDYVPIISRDEVSAEADQRIINNSSALKEIIDPAKLQTREDITKALNDAADHIEQNIDPRVGTRISFDAQKQLASDLNMSVTDLLGRKSGEAFSAEQAIASRAMLESSANNVLDLARKAAAGDGAARNQLAFSIAQHQEISNQIAGIASESGRALGSFKIQDADLPSMKIAKAMSELNPSALDEATKLLAKIDPSDPNYVRKTNEFVKEITPSTTADKLFEGYRNFLLSGPATVVKKVTSEAAMMALEATKKTVVGGLESLKSAVGVTDNPDAFASEGYWYAKGAAQALTHSKEILSGQFDLKDAPGFEHTNESAIKGTLGQIVRAPSTMIARQTNLVFAMNYFGELNSLAARQAIQEGLSGEELSARQQYLTQNPTQEMIDAANQMGLHNTFQNKLGAFGGSVSNAIQKSPITKFLFPFFKTPVNLVKASAEYSPYGALKGTAQGDLNLQTKGFLGSSIAAGIAYLATEGYITGGGPVNYKQRETKEATGWQPYSVRIGDKYYSYHRAEPLGLTLSLVSDAVHSGLHDEDPVTQSKVENAVNHITRNVQDFPFLMQLSSIVDSLTHLGQGNTAERVIDNLLASAVVPAAIKDTAQGIDRTVRSPERQGLGNPAAGLSQTIASRIPGLTGSVPAEINVAGKPVERPTSSLGGANPFPVTTEKNDAVISELARLGVTVENAPTKVKGMEPPTKQEAEQLQQMEQKAFYEIASQAISDPSWSDVPDAQKKKIIQRLHKAITAGRAGRLAQIRQPESEAPAPAETPDEPAPIAKFDWNSLPITSAPAAARTEFLSTKELDPLVKAASEKYDVDADLVSAVIKQESAGNRFAVSKRGAQGLMQLMPKTAEELGVKNPFDPAENVDAGVRYLASLLKQFGGDEKLALSAYNAGEDAVRKYGGIPPWPETQSYVKNISERPEVVHKNVLNDVITENKGLAKVFNPQNTTIVMASPERVAQLKKSGGGDNSLEFWAPSEKGDPDFPRPAGHDNKTVLEIYDPALQKDPDLLKKAVYGDLLHGMSQDPYYNSLRDQFVENYPDKIKTLREKDIASGKETPLSFDDMFIRGKLAENQGAEWNTPGRYSPEQLKTLAKMRTYIETGAAQ